MKDIQAIFKSHVSSSIEAKQELLNDTGLLAILETAAKQICHSIKNGGALHLCGNGGSASDAQHIAAELSGRYKIERPAINAEALHVNGSALTAIANDYGYEHAFARLLSAKANKGDVFIAISTSGNSSNVIAAIKTAKELGVFTIGMTGHSDSSVSEIADITIQAPSTDTPIIQECHITLGHILCDYIENDIFHI